jgi:hypothetical protein
MRQQEIKSVPDKPEKIGNEFEHAPPSQPEARSWCIGQN